jgi:hypothetical protein
VQVAARGFEVIEGRVGFGKAHLRDRAGGIIEVDE